MSKQRNATDQAAPSGAQVPIACGRGEAFIVEVGGGIRSYQVAGRDVLDGYTRGHNWVVTTAVSNKAVATRWGIVVEDR